MCKILKTLPKMHIFSSCERERDGDENERLVCIVRRRGGKTKWGLRV